MKKYSKFLIALLGAFLTVLAQQYGNNEWVQTILPLAAAVGVYSVPNKK